MIKDIWGVCFKRERLDKKEYVSNMFLISRSVSTHSHLYSSTCPNSSYLLFPPVLSVSPPGSSLALSTRSVIFKTSFHLALICPQSVLSYKRWGQGTVSASDRFVPARSRRKYAPSYHFHARSSLTHLGMTSLGDSTS